MQHSCAHWGFAPTASATARKLLQHSPQPCPVPLPARFPSGRGSSASMRRMPTQAQETAVAGFRCFMLEIKYLYEVRRCAYIGAPFGSKAPRLQGSKAPRLRYCYATYQMHHHND